MSFQPKASKAVQLWIAVVVGVLVVLFFETQNSRHMDTYNFVVSSDSDDIGADVIVDKQKLGKITASTADGPGGGVFMGYLSRGRHSVEVLKEGYKPYSKEFDMHHEQYLGVDLQAQSN